jgi:hypothetical protein
MQRIRHRLEQAVPAILIVGLLELQIGSPLQAQSRLINVGDFRLRIEASDYINTNEVDPTGEWPQDYFRYANIVFYNSATTVGQWTDSTGTLHEKEVYFYPVSYDKTEPYGIREVRKSTPPEVWVTANGQTLLSSRRFNGTEDPELPCDEMVELHYKSYPGFDVVKKFYAYSNPYHDDYVICVMKVKCTFDWDQDDRADTDASQTLKDVFFLIGYSFQPAEGTWITYSRWYEEAKDDWATFDTFAPELVSGGRPLQISYGWDGDHPDITEFEPGGPEFDDTGDPRFAVGEGGSTPMPSGEFVSSAYSGFAALYADKSPQEHVDDPNQPVSINANLSIYNVWDENFPGYATIWDWASSQTRQAVEDQSGWPTDASGQEDEFCFQAFGPYSFNLGDSLTIVYAVGANGISRNLAVEKGLEWRDWYLGVEGAEFDDAAKNELLATGRDSLFQTMDRAYWTWKNGLSVAEPLPSPDLTVNSGPNVIYLEWEDLSNVPDPNTGVADLDHYNVYRKQGDFLCDGYNELREDGRHTTWELIAEVPKSLNTYNDSSVVRGEPYHYAVTAMDDGSQNTDGPFAGRPLESSRYANRSEIAAYAFQPGMTDTTQVQLPVRVVPNPFISNAQDYNFSGAEYNKLLFVNLPPYCTLRIYTVTGDLIKTIKHASGSADESWDQVTDSNQLIASGVYLLQVSEVLNLAREKMRGPIGKGVIEKFVVIR